MSWTIPPSACSVSPPIFSQGQVYRPRTHNEGSVSAAGRERNHMNRTTKHLSKWATAMLAVGVAFASAPISRAGDQPSDKAAPPPAAVSQPAPASEAAAQPAGAQPVTDTQQKLDDLQKQMNLL